MDPRMVEFLTRHAIQDGQHTTHTSLIAPRMAFSFTSDNYDKFMRLYCKIIKENGVVGITELPSSMMPVVVDIDLERPYTEGDEVRRIYSRHHINDMVSIYQEVLSHAAHHELLPHHLWCAVFEKHPYIKDGTPSKIKNGFHLIFPAYIVERSVYQNVIYPRVLDKIRNKDIFADIFDYPEHTPIPYHQIYDKACTTNAWLMHGSRKDPSLQPYHLTMIIDNEFSPVSPDQLLNIPGFEYTWPNGERLPSSPAAVADIYPVIFSTQVAHRTPVYIRPELKMISMDTWTTSSVVAATAYVHRTREQIKEDMELAQQLMPLIDKSRADNYAEWIQMGWLLYNVSAGSDEGYDMWLNFSRLSDKFDESQCERVWRAATEGGMTVRSLCYYARIDSPDQFRNMSYQKSMNDANQILMFASHHDIAKMLKSLHNGKYVCASIRQRIWYEFRDHHWRIIEEGHSLRTLIHNDLERILEVYEQSLIHKVEKLRESDFDEAVMDDDDDDNCGAIIQEGKSLEAMQKALMRLRKNIKNAPFKNHVMTECMHAFYDDTFVDKLNTNPYLIGFNNGIYDLKNMMFRDGCPDDYISMAMDIDYAEFTEDDEMVKEVHAFLRKIFPDKSVRDYFLNVYCDVFVGGNASKHVMVWTGEGDNGKSVTENLFEIMLGKYAIKLPTSLLVGKRTQSSSACPELVRAGNGVRWALLQEPDQTDTMNVGILKELSGNDSIFARGLYKEGSEIKPMFKIILVCNDPPKIPFSDKATWNRIRVIPFESTFCDDAPQDEAEQMKEKRFKKDSRFGDKLPKMAQAFAWVLLNHRKNVRGVSNTAFAEPPKVLSATLAYRERNDIYRQYISESVTKDPEETLSLTVLYANFKNWFRESVSGITMPNKSEVRLSLTKIWGEPHEMGAGGYCWKGYKLYSCSLETGEDEVDI